MVLKSALLASTCVGLPAVFMSVSISAPKLSFSVVPEGHAGAHLGHVGAAARAKSTTTRSKFWISNGETAKIRCHCDGPHARRSILNAIANRVCATIAPVIPSYQSVHNILSKTRSEGDGNRMSKVSILFMGVLGEIFVQIGPLNHGRHCVQATRAVYNPHSFSHSAFRFV